MKESVYTPDSDLRRFGHLIRKMAEDLLASRELAWRLVVRNFSAQYRQSALGYFWAFVPPLFVTFVWVFLNSQKILAVDDPGMPYLLFVLTGTVLWQTFSEALESPLRQVTESKAMLAKINFPREAIILASIGQVLINFLVRLILLILVFFWLQIVPPLTVLLVPLGVFALILFGITVGLLLTPLGILYHDVGRAITVGTQAWFFLTPVIYPVPQSAWAQKLINLNPVTPLLQTSREWLVTGEVTQLAAFFWVIGLSILMLMAGWLLYRIAMPHLISRMSS